MGVFSRLSKVLESNLNSLIDRAEDPAKMLDQAMDDMRRGRDETKKAIIEAKTELKLAERKLEKANLEAQQYEAKAMAALEAGDEPLARRLLEAKLGAEERSVAEESAVASHRTQIEDLLVAEKELERRLRELPARRAALMARQAAAEARGAHTGATSKAKQTVTGALDAFDRMEERIIRAEVEAEVRSEMEPRLLDSGTLQEHRADRALEELKSKVRGQLPSGLEDDAAANGAEDKPADPVDDSLAELKARLNKK